MAKIKNMQKVGIFTLLLTLLFGCGLNEGSVNRADQQDPGGQKPGPQTPGPQGERSAKELKKRAEQFASRPPMKKPQDLILADKKGKSRKQNQIDATLQGPVVSDQNGAQQQDSKQAALDEVIDGIKIRHTAKLQAVRDQLSAKAVAAVEAEINNATETLRKERDYFNVESLVQKLAWLDVLLNPGAIAGVSMLNVLESIVSQNKLADFLTHYGWSIESWNWFYRSTMTLPPVNPEGEYSTAAPLFYEEHLDSKYFDLLESFYSAPKFWDKAGSKMERVLARRTVQLIRRDEKAVQWLRDLGFTELADALPPAQEPRGSNRIQLMTNYLKTVDSDEHKTQLKLLIPQVQGKKVLRSILPFYAGSEANSYHVTSMSELVEIRKVVELQGWEKEFWADREFYEEMLLYMPTPNQPAAEFHVKQFAIPS